MANSFCCLQSRTRRHGLRSDASLQALGVATATCLALLVVRCSGQPPKRAAGAGGLGEGEDAGRFVLRHAATRTRNARWSQNATPWRHRLPKAAGTRSRAPATGLL